MTLETAKPVLEKCPDFLHEKPKLQLQVEKRGHILELSPKGHPEMAGAGIEYVWGKTKCEWRRMPVEKRNTKNFMADLLKLFKNQEVLPLTRIRKFARKTRDCRRTHAKLFASEPLKPRRKAEIERVMKTQKSHRSVLSSHLACLRRT